MAPYPGPYNRDDFVSCLEKHGRSSNFVEELQYPNVFRIGTRVAKMRTAHAAFADVFNSYYLEAIGEPELHQTQFPFYEEEPKFCAVVMIGQWEISPDVKVVMSDYISGPHLADFIGKGEEHDVTQHVADELRVPLAIGGFYDLHPWNIKLPNDRSRLIDCKHAGVHPKNGKFKPRSVKTLFDRTPILKHLPVFGWTPRKIAIDYPRSIAQCEAIRQKLHRDFRRELAEANPNAQAIFITRGQILQGHLENQAMAQCLTVAVPRSITKMEAVLA